MLHVHRDHSVQKKPQEAAPPRKAGAAVKARLTTAGIALGAGALWGAYQIAQWRRRKK